MRSPLSTSVESASALIQQFAQPTNAFRGKPFWSWNGTLERSELLRQVHAFKQMGMGGFFMHSRTGLKTEYLGDEWFEHINACADEAERLGLEAWLYDEDRWPSGSAGGLATRQPEYRLKSLRLTIVPAAGFSWASKEPPLAAFQTTVKDLRIDSCRRLIAGEKVHAKAGKHVLLFTCETTSPHPFYNGNTYLDTLKREATDHFLALTHEQYLKHCGDRLGRSIRGIFTDEPHHGMVMCHKTETRQNEGPEWTTPYTDQLFEQFQKRFGYDLAERLPELFLFARTGRISQVKWHYMELIQQLFLENWAKPVHDWCRKNGLLLTGHILHEDSLAAQAVPCGSAMRYYEYFDHPGVDVLGNGNKNFCIVKQLSSAARQFGKPWALSELYGCTGWQLDFRGHKAIGAWQALFGINVRCHHLSWYTMEGEAKRDYPASIFFQSSWFNQYTALEDYFSRLHVVLQRGAPVCDVLVLNPVESLWAQVHAGWATWLAARDPEVEVIEERYREIFAWLTHGQMDFDYGDEDHLHRFGSVSRDDAGMPLLHLGLGAYRSVVVAGMETIRASSLRVLEEFHALGGSVIFVGKCPGYVDALPSDQPELLARKATHVPFTKAAVVKAVRGSSHSPLRIAVGKPGSANHLLCQVRRDGSDWIVVILNISKEISHLGVSIEFEATGFVQEWHCSTGERYRVAAREIGNVLTWNADFLPSAEKVFVIGPTELPALKERPAVRYTGSRTLEGPFEYELSEPNLCVLDFAEYRLANGAWQPAEEILQIDQKVRESLGLPQRSGTMIQPWARENGAFAVNHGGLNGSRKPTSLELRFSFEVSDLPETSLEILMENPAHFEIRCNEAVITPPDNPEWLIDPCFKRVPLPCSFLQLGTNIIRLQVSFHANIDLESIYLLGSFGVELAGSKPRLTKLPTHLFPGDVVTQGLPFYSGCITYKIVCEAPSLADGRTWLETGPYGGAVLSVRASQDTQREMICWPPYVADVTHLLAGNTELFCEVWLTRRNTFGPLHLVPMEQSHIGPDSFRSVGNAFSKSHQLIASGLLEAPKLHTSKPKESHAAGRAITKRRSVARSASGAST